MNDPKNNSLTRRRWTWVSAVVVAIIAILLYFAIQQDFLTTALTALQPILIGIVIAYLVNPLLNLVEKPLSFISGKVFKKEKTAKSVSRGIGTFFSLAVALTLISLIIYMLIPELVRTIAKLIKDLPAMIDSATAWYLKTVDDNEILRAIGDNVLGSIESWVKNIDSSVIMSTAKFLTTGVFSALGTTVDIIIGVIVSVYLLFSKELFFAQIKKFLYAFLDNNKVEYMISTAREGHHIMSGYLVGKIISSVIVGVICFIAMLILGLPYPLLISVFVGVTDIIPYFGPFIGAIPSAFLIFITDPLKGVYFVIMILVLQQVEGNMISPKILGDTTGLPAFWVIFAIIVGGGLFGFIGMIIGVPVLAIIFYILRKISNEKLICKKMPTATEEYCKDFIDDEPVEQTQAEVTDGGDNNGTV